MHRTPSQHSHAAPAPVRRPWRQAAPVRAALAFARALAEAWLPGACALCDGPLPHDSIGFCAHCAHALPGAGAPRCQRCALRWTGAGDVCGACLSRPPPWNGAITLADYAPPIDQLIVALKFHGEFAAARPLGSQLGALLRAGPSPPVDCLIPVPLSPVRLAERGYDQAAAIADSAARACGIPAVRGLLTRVRDTPAQSSLTLAARRTGPVDAFTASPRVAGRQIALVDDVMTSGATAEACTLALKAAGARSVTIVAATRTP